MLAVISDNHSLNLRNTPKAEIADPNDILVKVDYAAQNPIDVILNDNKMLKDGKIAGNDFSGTVVAIGSGVRDQKLVGKRIASFADGHNNDYPSGSFAEYAIAKDGIYTELPDSASSVEAATIPLAYVTAVHGLFSSTRLNLERKPSQTVLIWGGNSSVGRYALQLAKLKGHRVITTANGGNDDELIKLGADKVYYYRDAAVVDKAENGSIKFIFDAIGTASSASACAQTASNPSHYTTVRPDAAHTQGFPKYITISTIIVYQVFFTGTEEAELGDKYLKDASTWLKTRKLVCNIPKIVGGLERVGEGYQLHRKYQIKGVKLVYRVGEVGRL
ncbi:Zinc-type alcohol dehydrogenase-like protein C2E1P3.01 [Yarrowia sp. C11]|nr:Zinc-type alcohol dehydrogenase-like protein C2E1P3.01 [Yarrowia sp. E02]KAG5371369.1 Zinc-type alcohol dehydrogenase-like protein C2E1P3.01 [Yarrowia sp. C11]